MRPERLSLILALVVFTGCPGKIVEPPVDAGYTRSAKGNLHFKGNERLTYDFAVGLGLPVDEVCKELGQYSCSFTVHPVALGGIDPYGHGVYEAPLVTGATSAVVVERVALAACTRRVNFDLGTPGTALIFKAIPVAGGKLTAPSGPEVRLALTELAQRAWLRDPTEAELDLLIKLNTDIEATGVAEPAKAWMQSACFAVFSSAESVFY